MLQLDSVTAGYGDTMVLRDVDFAVRDGEVVALLGPNGAGKTTLLRAATGFVKPRAGTVTHNGDNMSGRSPHHFARRGICHLPEGRGIFPSLTVAENLNVFARGRAVDGAVDEAAALFPILGSRLTQVAGSLSGGEQQMLALSRAYLTKPEVVLVDEPSLGLAPLVVDKIYDALAHLVEQGISLIIVEQYVAKALELATKVYILSRGTIIHVGEASETDADQIYEKYLGVSK
jgi:branched-chain amino acid transport system ATP-binding protein